VKYWLATRTRHDELLREVERELDRANRSSLRRVRNIVGPAMDAVLISGLLVIRSEGQLCGSEHFQRVSLVDFCRNVVLEFRSVFAAACVADRAILRMAEELPPHQLPMGAKYTQFPGRGPNWMHVHVVEPTLRPFRLVGSRQR
jgi:hypothetical protein